MISRGWYFLRLIPQHPRRILTRTRLRDIVTPVEATGHIENAPLPKITKKPAGNEVIQNAQLGHPEMPAIPKHSRTVAYPTGHVVAFSDHLSPAEFDKAAKAAWQKIKEQ